MNSSTMARMSKEFEKVLKEERLSDVVAVFGDPQFCDEVPLYSRYEQVEFLKQYGDVNRSLLKVALAYLDRVTNEIRLRSKRFVALTVIRDSEDGYIVPSIFVCNSRIKSQLSELHLAAPSAGFGEQILMLVKKVDYHTALSVFEDRSTVAGEVRVFLSYRSPPSGLVALETFANGVGHRVASGG